MSKTVIIIEVETVDNPPSDFPYPLIVNIQVMRDGHLLDKRPKSGAFASTLWPDLTKYLAAKVRFFS